MEHTRVELQPRFPLFGGWKIDFILGYGLPLAETVFRPPSGGGFVLNTTFGSPIAGLVVEAMEVRVVLPEGAHSIQVHGCCVFPGCFRILLVHPPASQYVLCRAS